VIAVASQWGLGLAGQRTRVRTANKLNNKPDADVQQRWRLGLYAAWGAAYWAGQPPLSLPVAGWLSALAFAMLVMHGPQWTKREGWWAWIAASVVWLSLLHGIRLAFWPLTAGWIALSLYLAIYFPISIVMARSLALRLRLPMPLACAVAWTTCEVLRAHVATGFAGCMLVHSQTPWPPILQIASHFGGYGVGFLMTLSMAWIVGFAKSLREDRRPNLWERTFRDAIAVIVMAWLTISFLDLRRRDQYLDDLQPIKPIGRFLLIQGNMPTLFDATPELLQQGWIDYLETTRRALAEISDPTSIDVVLWPESIFGGVGPYMLWDQGPTVPKELGLDREQLESAFSNLQNAHEAKLDRLREVIGAANPSPNFLVGTDVIAIRNGRYDRYNAALWIGKDSDVSADFYAKQHLVMFGEYIPVLSWFPELLKEIGLGALSEGESPKAWSLENGRRVAPSICFEDMVPHLIQSQIRVLTQMGEAPDVLVNLSNDGWFRGSSALDHHLNSAIVTAVENRTPMMVAANTGLSAWIDGNGRVVQKLDRMQSGWILAEPVPDGRVGWWSWWGDFPARCIAVFGCMPLAILLASKLVRRKMLSS
jgi:apolipoprotein N-acyltransferase